MPALPHPKYGLDKLYLYPYYSTREAYQQATGQPCPPWNPNRRPQKWCKPDATDSSEDFILFERVLATNMKEAGVALAGPDGKPYLKSLVLPKEFAASVNIPPNTSNIEGADVPEYPVPLRAVEPNEEIFFDVLGVVMVRNTDLTPQADTGFTAEDRVLPRAIAKKLGA